MQKYYRESLSSLRFKYQTKVNFPAHLHNEIEVIYIINGSGSVSCDGKSYNLSEGDVFIAFPNQIHYIYDFPEDGEYYVLIISPVHLQYYASIFNELKPTFPKCHPAASSNLLSLIKIAYDEFEKGTSIHVLESLFTTIFGILLKHFELIRSEEKTDKLSEILSFCNNHYKEDISVETVSKALYISRSYISHTFNGKMDISFNDYINSLRVLEAERILQSGQYNVTEAAFLSGFSTPRTFYRAFKKIHGITPSEYIKAQRFA